MARVKPSFRAGSRPLRGLVCQRVFCRRSCGHYTETPVYGDDADDFEERLKVARRTLEKGPCRECRVMRL